MLKKDKPVVSENLAKLISEYPVIGIASMHKMPGRQLQQIKQKLGGRAVIKVMKKSILFHAFDKTGIKGVEKLKEMAKGEIALLLTRENQFKIYKEISKIKSPASAKAGDIAPEDIEIKAGPTDLTPGPAITALQKAGLKTKVEGGKISITADKVVCKKGDVITAELAALFTMLKMQPMKIGLNVIAMLENGIVYGKETLSIDEEKLMQDIAAAICHMTNLSVFIGYPTKETIELMIQKAYREMKNLGTETNAFEKEVIEDLIVKAEIQARNLSKEAKI